MVYSMLFSSAIVSRVAFRGFVISGCLASTFCLLLASPSTAHMANKEATEETEITSDTDLAEPIEEFSIEQTTEWTEAANLEAGFLQGCNGEAPTTLLARRIKRDFCQCAFSAYSERYSPYQFAQINTLASQIGESGIALVNLMMTNGIQDCSEETGFIIES